MALKTSSPGLRLQMMFDPFNAAVNDLSYEFTLTSFGEYDAIMDSFWGFHCETMLKRNANR